MPNRRRVFVATVLVLVSGGAYLSHPPVVNAVPCSAVSVHDLRVLFCGNGPGSCSVSCLDNEFTGFDCRCG